MTGSAVEKHQGLINNYMGDGYLALFGLQEPIVDLAVQAVCAALDILHAMDTMRPYLLSAYDQEFDVRIGVHPRGTIFDEEHQRKRTSTIKNRASRLRRT